VTGSRGGCRRGTRLHEDVKDRAALEGGDGRLGRDGGALKARHAGKARAQLEPSALPVPEEFVGDVLQWPARRLRQLDRVHPGRDVLHAVQRLPCTPRAVTGAASEDHQMHSHRVRDSSKRARNGAGVLLCT